MTDDDFLRAELRHELTSHQPDRTAMLNRIAANRAAGPSPRGRRLRLAGAAAAVATVLGLGGVAQWALADEHGPNPPAAPPVPVPTTTLVPSSPAPSSPAPSRPVRTSTAPSSAPAASSAPPPSPTAEVRGHPGDTQVEKGTLWSDGSVAADGRSQVTLKAGTDLTSLDLVMRVSPAAGLTSAGVTSPDGERISASVSRSGDALLYRFTLAPGATLPAGTYVFTARYGGAIEGRDAGEDTYEAFADTTVDDENKRLHVYGNYFPED
ncbi:hypothetical protein Ade02nite_81440 [Paractinoplanes deccanensis]|uniref:Uncharacterized protein n=1 Tax=Paractinoplanes deccanensis TaxID=113561 RepID=A0ABQ3YHK9_9ACTN|nr:hypothetical protein [Actinoplanes deccanensis]GID79503.1 hypothetical protein Ade02nite_81440 [Actinoplanes deccanensis]